MFDRRFDWNSLDPFSYTGPWQLLELDAIEGFKHKQGARSLEYVDKYRLRKQPPGAPDFAYVYGSRMVPHAAP